MNMKKVRNIHTLRQVWPRYILVPVYLPQMRRRYTSC
jgi:hypothetical protein